MPRPTKVWIADDDNSIRWVLEKTLSQAGIDNESFADADELLAQIGNEQPDVIISDIRMPGTDGLALLAQINERFPELPVIITTAHSDLDSAVTSYQRGAFEYLPKPFDLDEVIAVQNAPWHIPKRKVAPRNPLTFQRKQRLLVKPPRCRKCSAR